MHRFFKLVIEPLLDILKPVAIVEIGSDHGFNTRNLLDFCADHQAKLHVIDPLPKYDVAEWMEKYAGHLVFYRSLSLNALPQIDRMDVVLIDGDHNWYTVINELQLIDRSCNRNGYEFPVVLLHDVGWPYGRRDLYYNPETIPAAFQKPYKRLGMRPGDPELIEKGGLNSHLYNSIYENDLQNGVLTAVEDFLASSHRDLTLIRIPAIFGLGILFPSQLREGNQAFGEFVNQLALPDSIIGIVEQVERLRVEVEIDREEERIAYKESTLRYEREAAVLRTNLDDRQQQLAVAEQRKTELAAQLSRLQAELEGRALELREKGKQLTSLEERLGKSEEIAANRAQELQRVRSQLEDRTVELRAKEQQLTSLEERLGLAEALATSREKETQQVHLKLARLTSELGDRDQSIESLHSRIASLESDILKQRKAAEALHIRISEHDQQSKEKNQRLAEIESQLMERERQLALQASNVRNCTVDVRRLSRWIEQLNHDTEALVNSWRWRTGNTLARSVERALLKPKAALAIDHMQNILKQFRNWRPYQIQTDAAVEEKKSLTRTTEDGGAMHVLRSGPSVVATKPSVDIVVCVHNALDDVMACLQSVIDKTRRPYMLYLVNDGSNTPTTDYLRNFASRYDSHVVLLENTQALGYTRAANRGMKASTGDYVILLNSDTIVTVEWIESIVECGQSDHRIGIIGPLSNAATWQSVPELTSPKGGWAVNPLPDGITVDDMATIVSRTSRRQFPRVDFINGFCYVIKRSVIKIIGYFDEENFPRGYGEENDYALRAKDAGFFLAVADHTYVYHAWSKSFSAAYRDEFSPKATAALQRKYDPQRIKTGTEALRYHPDLVAMRNRVRGCLDACARIGAPYENKDLRVLYLLIVRGGGGGAHMVVQNVLGMHELGIHARIAIKSAYRSFYLELYPDVPQALFFFFDDEQDLIDHAGHFSVVVATHFSTVKLLQNIHQKHTHILPGYFIQDYEPWIIPKNHPLQQEAFSSYTRIPDMICFAMSDWIRDKVKDSHSIIVQKVEPAFDTKRYRREEQRNFEQQIVITAMVRPSTPRRGPLETMTLLKTIKNKYKHKVLITVFGCPSDDPGFLTLPIDFEFENRGYLAQDKVAEVLGSADIFVDMSSFQAFGLTGIEAMSCGCAVVLPANCGPDEYAVHGENALLVDTTDLDAAFGAVCELVENSNLRNKLSQNAVTSINRYSIHGGALSQVNLFKNTLADRSVTIIVPIYNAYDELVACIGSVIRNTHQRYQLILIDDCSSDERIWPLLQSYSKKHSYIQIDRNDQNLGYTTTINKAIKTILHGDVVLLNSDTEVTSGWLVKLRETAYSVPNVATVTPLSNAAGAFSVPENNAVNHIPPLLTVDGVAEIVERLSVRVRPRTPTGNGFCMYITRKAIDAVGLFDESNFPRGYGEENDFCMRATAKGLVHLIEDSTFIYHKRSASFGDEKQALFQATQEKLHELHPAYKTLVTEWLARDELADFRRRLKEALAAHAINRPAGSAASSKPLSFGLSTILYILHDGKGGTIHTSEDLIHRMGGRYRCLLLKASLDSWTLLELRDHALVALETYAFSDIWKVQDATSQDRLSAFPTILRKYRIDLVHVRHLIGIGPELIAEIRSLNVPSVFSFHDFFTVCPTINLIDNQGVYCGGHCTPGDGICQVSKSLIKQPPPLKHKFVHVWRQRVGQALRLCDRWVTTSAAARSVIVDHFPFLDDHRFGIIEHGRDLTRYSACATLPGSGSTKIIVFGNLGFSKGIRHIEQLLIINQSRQGPFEFHFLGDLHGDFYPEQYGGIRHGSFQRDELPNRLAQIRPSFSIIASIWPETYCHTLTESWAAGIPVFASEIGTLKERIERHGGGWLLDYRDPEAWFEGMLSVIGSPSEYFTKLEDIRKMHFKTTQEMADEYEKLYLDVLKRTPAKPASSERLAAAR